MAPPPILLLDARDSFVWNLAQAFARLGHSVEVRRADRTTLDELTAAPAAALVLSPGPGRPSADDLGPRAVRALSGRLPILGVCLGHQAIAVAFGGRLSRGEPCHGRAEPVVHDGSGPFRGLPSPMLGARYHSLVVAPDDVPPCLRATARTGDGVVMGLAHREHATFGVQFHPESFLTPHGMALIERFSDVLR